MSSGVIPVENGIQQDNKNESKVIGACQMFSFCFVSHWKLFISDNTGKSERLTVYGSTVGVKRGRRKGF